MSTSPTVETAATTPPRRHWLVQTFRTPLGILALTFLTGLIALVIFGPIIWGDAAVVANPKALSQGPSSEHIFGTDAGGRDVFARTMTAARLSVLMALSAVGLGVALGLFLGTLPLLAPRWIGRFVVAFLNFAIAFPGLLLAIFLLVVLGQGSGSAVIAIGLAMASPFARLTYALSSSVNGRDFIDAARILGVTKPGLLFRHILPNIREPLIVNASISVGSGLVVFAGLSFLGLGIQPPSFDWGRMLNEGLSKIFVNPATALAPGIAVVLSGLTFTLVGEAIARGAGIRSPISSKLPRWNPINTATSESPSAPVDDNAVLTVRNMSVAVPAGNVWRRPVDNISFTVHRGETVGIVGESGSGKSLSCMAISQLTDHPTVVDAGLIEFDGTVLMKDGKRPEGSAARKIARQLGTRMSMVFQDPMSSMNPSLKVGYQVAEIGWLHEGMSKAEAKKAAIDRLTAVKIPDAPHRAKQYPHEFSGGMRQRAMIAMGLMGKPALIIADEPTTALDVTVQREVLGLLHEVREETGAAILLISHDMAVITGMCSRVLVMFAGNIVEDISVDDLVAGRSQHPYTRALIAAVPTMTTDRDKPLATVDEVWQVESLGTMTSTADAELQELVAAAEEIR
ncbi:MULTISPECIES: dipeptide/oligopeptide/nickel ABC transporter permease/ATP-binding protein [unclassified Rhodococcus (in: high G+C Gram-positive bacteria)]|uniref:dipeptide/oligopeptide/nickel ABC transporter permease/ATP-binding protein n=1 Tax=Rhodococcus TaxID=1827 RepID=UPI0005DEC9E5|nr:MULTISPECIES: dipeptide/oligopeptide/nickel ABC transporter permease/ATP-binding protein [unclassified Rhodococcus (in: high G+C Gram-positive bacteria)]KJF22266.1 Glutathione import ATP-binding protein GsiA [Rhodococcus sp. AD45]